MRKKKPAPRTLVPTKPVGLATSKDLLTDLRTLIEQARDATARAVNSALVLLYWSIGERIRRDILMEKRAEYGERFLGQCPKN